jgi:hypothetical protein
MDVDEIIRSALEREASQETLPPSLYPSIRRRSRVRRAVLSTFVTVATAAVVCGAVVGMQAFNGTATGPGPNTSLLSGGQHVSPGRIAVPDVTGLTEAEAVRSLGQRELIAVIRFDDQAPRTGKVLESSPTGGSMVDADSLVHLRVAYGPSRPTPRPDEEQQSHPIAHIVEANPDAFVGLYRDITGMVVVVFDPNVEVRAWREKLDTAANGLSYRTEWCSHSLADLQRVQSELQDRAWSPNAKSIAFGAFVDSSTCTVRVDSDQLTAADLEDLTQRFGPMVSFNTTPGAAPNLLIPTR